MANTKLWKVDAAHSEVHFKVKHLVISTVTGSFKIFSGEVNSDGDNFNGSNVSFSIDVKSIDTNNADRDNHLRSEDFFAAEKFATIDFKNGVLTSNGSDDYVLTGDLTIHGVTKPVTFNVEHGGVAKDPYGNTKAGFEVEGKINRKDFGLTWNATTEAGGLLVGEDIKLQINIQLIAA